MEVGISTSKGLRIAKKANKLSPPAPALPPTPHLHPRWLSPVHPLRFPLPCFQLRPRLLALHCNERVSRIFSEAMNSTVEHGFSSLFTENLWAREMSFHARRMNSAARFWLSGTTH